jgi:hypothetical protein
MGDFVAAVEGEGLAGLEEGVHGFEGALSAGDFGVAGGLIEQGGGLEVPVAVEAEVSHGERLGEGALDFGGGIELGGEVVIESVEGGGVFGGEEHVTTEEAVAGVVAGGDGLALGGDWSAGFGAVGTGGGALGFAWCARGWAAFGWHCGFIVRR